MRRSTSLAAVVAVAAGLLAPATALAWGALAISQTDDGNWSYGLTWNAQSREEAMQGAMTQCRNERHGTNCRLVTTFNGLCIGVAFRNGGNGYGWATRRVEREARAAAHQSCLDSNPACSVATSQCDGAPSSPAPAPQPNRGK